MTRSSREELLEAIDELARAAHSGNHRYIASQRRRTRTLALLLVPVPKGPFTCECGIGCQTLERLAEHIHYVHDGPKPGHWHEGAPTA